MTIQMTKDKIISIIILKIYLDKTRRDNFVAGTKIKYTSKSEYVYQILRERIMQGDLKTNKRYKVVKIADELGVSRTPVSNAVKILASQGFVTLLPSVGFEVKQLTLKEVEGILIIRGALEELAVEFAIDNATSKEIANLRDILRSCEAAVRKKDTKKYSKLNEEFHFRLYNLAALPNLVDTFKNLWTHEGWYNEELKANPNSILTLVEDHFEILNIIESKEKSKIKEIIRNHINNCLHVVSQPLSNMNIKGQ
jgi:DNA-binding GntR family transcriptional regulator